MCVCDVCALCGCSARVSVFCVCDMYAPVICGCVFLCVASIACTKVCYCLRCVPCFMFLSSSGFLGVCARTKHTTSNNTKGMLTAQRETSTDHGRIHFTNTKHRNTCVTSTYPTHITKHNTNISQKRTRHNIMKTHLESTQGHPQVTHSQHPKKMDTHTTQPDAKRGLPHPPQPLKHWRCLY